MVVGIKGKKKAGVSDPWDKLSFCWMASKPLLTDGDLCLLQIFWNRDDHSPHKTRWSSSYILAPSETDKLAPRYALKELPRKAPLTSLLRKLLKMNPHYTFFCSSSSSTSSSGSIRSTVSTKENVFHIRLSIHIREICTDRDGYHMWNNSKKAEFLMLLSDACEMHLCKAPDCWSTSASVPFLLSILLKQVKAFIEHNPANCWALSWQLLNISLCKEEHLNVSNCYWPWFISLLTWET